MLVESVRWFGSQWMCLFIICISCSLLCNKSPQMQWLEHTFVFLQSGFWAQLSRVSSGSHRMSSRSHRRAGVYLRLDWGGICSQAHRVVGGIRFLVSCWAGASSPHWFLSGGCTSSLAHGLPTGPLLHGRTEAEKATESVLARRNYELT